MDEKDIVGHFIAPQNSTIEGYRIPRYTNDPLRVRNSAPPTVTTTPHNSFLHLEKKKERDDEKLWWKNEAVTTLPIKELKAGINVKNVLQNRLYQYPNQKV